MSSSPIHRVLLICLVVLLAGQAGAQDPSCLIDPLGLLEFGLVPVGGTATRDLVITNVGWGTLEGDVPAGLGDFTVIAGAGHYTLGHDESHVVTIEYAPTEPSSGFWMLDVGNEGCPWTIVRGQGVIVEGECGWLDDQLDFGELVVGESSTLFATILNMTDAPLDFDCSIADPAYQFPDPDQVSGTLVPGEDHLIRITFAPTENGDHASALDVGNPFCGPLPLRGSAIGALDMVGVFFDAGGLEHYTETTGYGEIVTGYVVLSQLTETGGVAGAGFRVSATGTDPVVVADVTIPGGGINHGGWPDFDLGFPTPLPFSEPTVLANVSFEVATPSSIVLLGLRPLPGAPSGQMVYSPGDDPGREVVMHEAQTPGVYQAWINGGETPIGVAAPAPTVTAQAGGFGLEIEFDPGIADGVHVYRQVDGSGIDERLTARPLDATDGHARYVDPGHGLVDGAVVLYSYALLDGGREVARSQAIQVVFRAPTPLVTRLLPAYPNPFNPRTSLAFELAGSERVRVEIFDLAGRRVRTLVDETLPAGRHVREWNGRDDRGRGVPSGTYFGRMRGERMSATVRLTLLK